MNTEFENNIREINKVLMMKGLESLPVGLFHGKLGICIYFFYLARIHNDKKYECYAHKILNNIYSDFTSKMNMDFENELAEVGFGINYLINNKFAKGNVNSILEELDDTIFRTVNFYWLNDPQKDNFSLIKILFYYAERLKKIEGKSVQRYIYQDFIIKIINHLYNKITRNELIEPTHFSLNYLLVIYLFALSEIYKLNIFNPKIENIFEDLSPIILSTFPMYQSNRLYLFLGIKAVLNNVRIPKWEDHANLLNKNINHEFVLKVEMKSKNIGVNNGICGYTLLLALFDQYMGTKILSQNQGVILNKIQTSTAWDNEYNPNKKQLGYIGLLNGLSGIALVYFLLIK